MARPTMLNQVVKIDGTREITAGEHVVARIELGLTQDAAARESNISLRTLQNWRQRGAAARAAQAQGKPVPSTELPFIDFLENLEAAEARWELRHLQHIDAAGSEPQRVKKVTIQKEMQTVNGQQVLVEVGRTEVVEERPPLWTASAWLLERKIPQRYARRFEVDDGTGQGRDPAERAGDLASAARAYLQGIDDASRRDGVIETTVVDDIATGG